MGLRLEGLAHTNPVAVGPPGALGPRQCWRFTGIIPVCEFSLINLEWYWYVVFESGMHFFYFLACYFL